MKEMAAEQNVTATNLGEPTRPHGFLDLSAPTFHGRPVWLPVASLALALASMTFTYFLHRDQGTGAALAAQYLTLFGLGTGVLLVSPGLIFRGATRATRVFRYLTPWTAALAIGAGLSYLLSQSDGFRYMLAAIPVGALIGALWDRVR